MIHRRDYMANAEEAAAHLTAAGLGPADVVLQCGSGMARLGELLLPDGKRVEMASVPHLIAPQVAGHGHEVVFGTVGGARLLILTGRPHIYEGHSPEVAGFPAAVAKALGATLFIAMNAAGGLNQHLRGGELMLHNDFINFQGDNALAHIATDDAAERFIDPKPAYNLTASGVLARHLQSAGCTVHNGIYVGVRGPIFETRAEIYMLRSFGADAVAMSIVPEVTVCNFLALPCIGLSVITN
ncbi:MAG: purine-nucleoside phosphorylase, partial [bacterium]|nr:purine-nucleoside phosphorylase [bacterium]